MSDQGLGEASGLSARPQPGTSGAATLHTPGPWRVGEEVSGRLSAVESDAGDIGYFTLRDPGERRANAQLIAAAPDLLALARNLERWLLKDAEPSHVGSEDMRIYHLDGGVLGNLLNEARAAIAKATSPSASIGGS